VEYFSAACQQLDKGERMRPPAVIRIGCKGEGQYPNYRIEHEDGEILLGPFNGRTHEDLRNPDNPQPANWSKKTVTYDEVRSLYLQIPAAKK
jgi:hypothetical protein